MHDAVTIETGPQPDAAVILLHGLGADGHDFAPVVPELALPPELPVRFRFPHAPERPVTINGGVRMPAWFDILGLDRQSAVDEAGIRASAQQLAGWIDAEVAAGIARERIVVAGFSQGGAIALFHALRDPRPLAGVVGLSTYLPLASTVEAERGGREARLPVLLAHGVQDPVLPLALAEEARSVIESLGHPVTWRTFNMPHSVCAEEIVLLRQWLLERLAPQG